MQWDPRESDCRQHCFAKFHEQHETMYQVRKCQYIMITCNREYSDMNGTKMELHWFAPVTKGIQASLQRNWAYRKVCIPATSFS